MLRGFLGQFVLWSSLLGCLPGTPAVAAVEMVEFPVTDFQGRTFTLTGKLTRPEGPGPFPAIVALHGCDGMDFDDPWAARLFAPWGYITLEVDSFGPRGRSSTCETGALALGANVRALDAHAGKAYLAGLAEVELERIAVWGWSDGGTTALMAVTNPSFSEPWRPHPFAAGVAFYPRCPLKLYSLASPILILIGEADQWNNVAYCRAMTQKGARLFDFELRVYPGASHGFDWPDAPESFHGREVRFDPIATADAYARAKAFLERHLEPSGY